MKENKNIKEINQLRKKINNLEVFSDKNFNAQKQNTHLILEELKFWYKNIISIYDYVLGFTRQIFAIFITGYFGLNIIPNDKFSQVFLKKINNTKIILLVISIILLISIAVIIHKKIIFSKKVDSIIKKRVEIIYKNYIFEQEIADRMNKIKDKFAELDFIKKIRIK